MPSKLYIRIHGQKSAYYRKLHDASHMALVLDDILINKIANQGHASGPFKWRYMTQDKIIEMTKTLIAIPSTADNNPALHEAVAFIADFIASKQGLTVEKFASNGVPSILAYAGSERPDKFDILFNGHVDVVAGRPQDYTARVENGRLYGRGAYDMKLSAVIMAAVFYENALTTSKKIGLQIVADEEVGGFNGAHYQLKQGIPESDLAISGEMTDLQICNEIRGICWTEVNFKGKKAHSAYAWDGKNALAMANEFVQILLSQIPVPKQTTWTTTANVASISTSNQTYNLVPDNAKVCVDFRFTPEDERFKNRESVCRYIKTIAPDAQCAIKLISSAIEVSATNPSLQKLIGAFESATGKPSELIKRYGSSDARHFAEFGQNCVEFGPSGKGMHGDNEYALLESILPFKSTLEALINL